MYQRSSGTKEFLVAPPRRRENLPNEPNAGSTPFTRGEAPPKPRDRAHTVPRTQKRSQCRSLDVYCSSLLGISASPCCGNVPQIHGRLAEKRSLARKSVIPLLHVSERGQHGTREINQTGQYHSQTQWQSSNSVMAWSMCDPAPVKREYKEDL